MILTSPDRHDRASRLVDWIEVRTLQNPGRWIGLSEIGKILRIQDAGRENRLSFDGETQESLEQEILEEGSREILSGVADELRRRVETLAGDYPFELKNYEPTLTRSLSIKVQSNTTFSESQYSYILCLLISAIRWGLLSSEIDEGLALSDGNLAHSEYRYGQLLQVCATIALGGYIQGPVYSFGYPRPDGSNFLAAHRSVWTEFGAYRPVDAIPIGLPNSENDAGIDLIGWLEFNDRSASKILVIGQVASGRNWSGKSVVDRALSLGSWFGGPSFKWFTPAMVMPFNITDSRVTIQTGGSARELRKAVLEHEERAFGIMIDRDRLTSCVRSAFALSEETKNQIQAFDQFDIVKEWVDVSISKMR